MTQSHGIHWLGPLSFVAQQCAMFLGFWFVAWAWAMIDRRPWKDRDPQRQFLWWMSAPMFLNFMLFSFKNGGGQVNWPVTAYSSGLVLTLGWLAEQLNGSLVWRRRLALGSLVASTTAGIVLVVLMHFAVEAQPVLKQIAHPAFPGARFPLRKIDPTCRLRGWRYLASRVDEVRSQLAGQGEDVVLMSSSWRLPGELRFYCSGQPTVYSIGRALGERWSQYDFWRPNPLHDDERFQGKTVILVGLPPCAVISEGFEELVSTQQVTYCEEGEPIADWHITVYRGYRGFPKIHGNTY